MLICIFTFTTVKTLDKTSCKVNVLSLERKDDQKYTIFYEECLLQSKPIKIILHKSL